MREDAEDKKTIDVADERSTHQTARKIEQDERKRKAEEDGEDKHEASMQDGVEEGKEEDAPAKRTRTQDSEHVEIACPPDNFEDAAPMIDGSGHESSPCDET